MCWHVAVPDYQSLMAPVLHALADGQEQPNSRLRETLAGQLDLTDEDLRATIPSGSPLFASRVHWAVTYLYHAGLLSRPRRGVVQITQRGREVLAKHPDRVDLTVLNQFEEFVEFRSPSRDAIGPESGVPGTVEATPRETVSVAIEEANAAVAAEVLDRVRGREPAFLEHLVLDVLTAMGYGGVAGAAEHLGRVGDEGLDGVIRQDALGLDRIYVQAKRYRAEQSVGRPEIQAFVGALQGTQADRGIFITTSRFTADAATYAERVPARVVLIDGRMLAELMVKHNIGVQDQETYVIKRIDEDFFEDAE
jgi:restriction system protein